MSVSFSGIVARTLKLSWFHRSCSRRVYRPKWRHVT